MDNSIPSATKASKKFVIDASEAQCFWVNFGPVVKNLSELKKAVEEMSDEQYNYHTKRNVNDFACWVEEVFGAVALAKKLGRAKSRASFVKVLEKSLV